MGDDITENFPNWNYGTTLGGQGQHGGYTEYRDRGSYGSHGYGFTGPRGGGFGGRGGRCPLPSQEEIMPQEVAGQVAKEEEVMEKMPGVIIKNEDGSLVKVVDPNTPMPMPDVRPEPTRFDKSVHGILNGRNAAMFVNIECKKRGWELEFEEVDAEGPVHDRTYSYTLTIGPPDSEDVTVTAGIAKSKKDAKKRCCEAMVLKLDDLPPAPPLHMQPHMMGRGGFNRFPGPGRFMRGFPGPRGFPGFRPRLPPPESEDTIFKKYDKTPNAPHPSQHHPISKLCERAKKFGWPQPVWDLVNEKIIDSKKHKHGRHNTMLYTFKVTVYPGKGQVEPKVYFGSGPTKKDAKFACGSVAWADQEGGSVTMQGKPNTSHQEPPAAAPVLDPEALKNDPAQLAVEAEAEVNKPKKRAGDKVTKSRWLDVVAKDLEIQNEAKKIVESTVPRPPTQLLKRVIPATEVKEEPKVKEESQADEETKVKEEPVEEGEIEDDSNSGSMERETRSRSKSRSKRDTIYKERDDRSRSKSYRDREDRSYSKSHRDRNDGSRSKRDDDGRHHRDRDRDRYSKERYREERRSPNREDRRGYSRDDRDGFRSFYDRPGHSSSHRDRDRGRYY